ncbi:MAG: GNAT family N-acetyltransferase [Proteobacteria bacterium]|nr:GNAT family N-acetyltransferase [Pseudomonadota bacterium]MBU1737451.1 GNAT family N-acetyltransferase [Pseudomonadota bacterium]
MKTRVCADPEECKRLWAEIWPVSCFFDLWEVRSSFAAGFARPTSFLVAEEGNKIQGLLALSWIEESDCYGIFPGETWQGKTWLEQNRIPVRSVRALEALLANIPGPARLRYLTEEAAGLAGSPVTVDETGYLFRPGEYGFSFSDYMLEFSGKSRKKLAQDSAKLEKHGVSFRYGEFADIQRMFRMNLEAFGRWSYFWEPRFLNSFERLVEWLDGQGFLRITTLLLGGEVAAIDIGAVWNNTYTVLAGGTSSEFVGVAKMINFHHLRWACEEKLALVDFLCGDFGWKERFHLQGRPLYKLQLQPDCHAAQPIEGALKHASGQF